MGRRSEGQTCERENWKPECNVGRETSKLGEGQNSKPPRIGRRSPVAGPLGHRLLTLSSAGCKSPTVLFAASHFAKSS